MFYIVSAVCVMLFIKKITVLQAEIMLNIKSERKNECQQTIKHERITVFMPLT